MDINGYMTEIKIKLTGGVLEFELSDNDLQQIINASLREIQRYIDSTTLITIPFSRCIDLTKYKVNSVVGVYRADILPDSTDMVSDPAYTAQWQYYVGSGSMVGMKDWVLNLGAYNTMLQTRSTLSTDLAFIFNKASNLLYINIANGTPNKITIEYIQRYDDVSQITSDYWIDMLMRLALAQSKIALGRIRGKYTQNNALWGLDSATLLAEGNEELNALREQLLASTQLSYPID